MPTEPDWNKKAIEMKEQQRILENDTAQFRLTDDSIKVKQQAPRPGLVPWAVMTRFVVRVCVRIDSPPSSELLATTYAAVGVC